MPCICISSADLLLLTELLWLAGWEKEVVDTKLLLVYYALFVCSRDLEVVTA